MSIPNSVTKTNTAAGYMKYLASSINLADKYWTHYAWTLSKAYTKAYENNERVLMTVKKNQEAQRAANEALMAFALSLVTVGVAGGVAGAIARSVAKKAYDGSKVVEMS